MSQKPQAHNSTHQFRIDTHMQHQQITRQENQHNKQKHMTPIPRNHNWIPGNELKQIPENENGKYNQFRTHPHSKQHVNQLHKPT